MAEFAELRSITIRKRLLQAESELHRRGLALHLAGLRADTAWMGQGVAIARRYRRVLLVLAPVAGFLLARRRPGPPAGWLGRGLAALQIWRTFQSALARFSGTTRPT